MTTKQRINLSGKVLKIKSQANQIGGQEIRIENYWDIVYGRSWRVSDGNPAVMMYAIRTGTGKMNIPFDDEVLYGKINGLGYLVHITEIEPESLAGNRLN